MAQQFACGNLAAFRRLAGFCRAEAERIAPPAFFDDLVEPDKGASADKQDLVGADLNVLLVRVLAAALRGTLQTVPSRSTAPAPPFNAQHRG